MVEELRDATGFFFDGNGGGIMIIAKIVFWLLAIPIVMIIVGVI